MNQSSNGNVIHKDDVKFPSQNAANFRNSMGPGPISKKGYESPDCSLITVLDSVEMELC